MYGMKRQHNAILAPFNEDSSDFVELFIEWNRDPSAQPDLEGWYRRGFAADSFRSNHIDISDDHNFKINKEPIDWKKHIDVSETVAGKLNEIHAQLNEFMFEHKREKLVILNKKTGKIEYELDGVVDKVWLGKELKRFLKTSDLKSLIPT